jgi:hypothetical protein
LEIPNGRHRFEDLDEGITLKSILKKQGGGVWTGFAWLRIGISGETLVHVVNESSGVTKEAECLE